MNKINSDMDIFESIKLSQEYTNLWNNIITNTEWKEVTNATIAQPVDAENGTQYVVLLKKELNGTTTYDAQVLTSKKETSEDASTEALPSKLKVDTYVPEKYTLKEKQQKRGNYIFPSIDLLRPAKHDPQGDADDYDFHYTDRYGYPGVLGGISHMFRQEFWNYAKLISGVIRNGMPIVDILNLVKGLNLDDESINTWKNGVERALKQYIPNGTKDETGQKCEKCGSTNLIYQEGCLICQDCGHGKCG